MSSAIPDLLAAASLLLAAVGVVYESWYTELRSALDAAIPTHAADRLPIQSRLRSALLRRALPLAALSLATGVVLLPDAVRTTMNSFTVYSTVQATHRLYDPLSTLFVIVEFFTLLFSFHLVGLAIALGRRLAKTKK